MLLMLFPASCGSWRIRLAILLGSAFILLVRELLKCTVGLNVVASLWYFHRQPWRVAEGKLPDYGHDVRASTHMVYLATFRSTLHPIQKLGTPTVGRSSLWDLETPRHAPIPDQRPLQQTMDDTVCGPERLDMSLISWVGSYYSPMARQKYHPAARL